MGAFTVAVNSVMKGVPIHNGKVDTPSLTIVAGLLTGPASYDPSGSVVDLSSFLSRVDRCYISPFNGVAPQYVAGASVATSLGKAYNSGATHSHGLKIVGGQATGQLLQVLSGVLGKSNLLIKTGTLDHPNPYVAGGTTLNLNTAVDLDGSSTTAFAATPIVMTNIKAISDHVARYVVGTGPTDGKIAITVMSTGVELGGVDATAIDTPWIAIGTRATTGDVTATGGTDNVQNEASIGGTETAAATNLSTYTFPFFAIGTAAVT